MTIDNCTFTDFVDVAVYVSINNLHIFIEKTISCNNYFDIMNKFSIQISRTEILRPLLILLDRIKLQCFFLYFILSMIFFRILNVVDSKFEHHSTDQSTHLHLIVLKHVMLLNNYNL